MNTIWYDIFLEELYKKYPQKSELTEALMSLLSLEREATYRRLRRDVMFPIEEVMKIASSWQISLDRIVGISSAETPFKTQLLNYINPSKDELESMRRTVKWYNSLRHIPDMEYLEACNKIPRSLSSGFPYLRKLQLLRWMHQHGHEEAKPFSEVNFPPEVLQLSAEYHQSIKQIENTCYIWDIDLFRYVVRGVHYFYFIGLITDEDKQLIKNELLQLLDYMSDIAKNGCWPDTGKRVNLYISHVNLETNYSYFYSEAVRVCFVHAFVKSELYTSDVNMVEKFKNWMKLKKRSSTLISETDEKSRIDFFRKQYLLIEEL